MKLLGMNAMESSVHAIIRKCKGNVFCNRFSLFRKKDVGVPLTDEIFRVEKNRIRILERTFFCANFAL
jgi:hypothetical protein